MFSPALLGAAAYAAAAFGASPTRDERSGSVGGGLLAAWIILDLIVLAGCAYVVRRRKPGDRGRRGRRPAAAPPTSIQSDSRPGSE